MKVHSEFKAKAIEAIANMDWNGMLDCYDRAVALMVEGKKAEARAVVAARYPRCSPKEIGDLMRGVTREAKRRCARDGS